METNLQKLGRYLKVLVVAALATGATTFLAILLTFTLGQVATGPVASAGEPLDAWSRLVGMGLTGTVLLCPVVWMAVPVALVSMDEYARWSRLHLGVGIATAVLLRVLALALVSFREQVSVGEVCLAILQILTTLGFVGWIAGRLTLFWMRRTRHR